MEKEEEEEEEERKKRRRVCSPHASVRGGSLLLRLGLGDSNPAWLIPAVTPHPNVERILSVIINPAGILSVIYHPI